MKFRKNISVIISFVIIFTKISICLSENTENQQQQQQRQQQQQQQLQNTILDNFTWECANNASCINSIAKNVLSRYQRKEIVDFGLFSIKKSAVNSNVDQKNLGRSSSSSSFMQFLNGNEIRVPIGPMVFSVQRSDDNNYLEIALLRKIQAENGRRHGGGGGGGRIKEKKHMQMYIPMYLAATTFGWTLAAIKAVGVITIKALFVSKLALIIAAALIIKKLMESAAEKMYIPHYPEHHHEHPFMLPYNMEFAHLPHALAGAEINPHELYSLHMGHPHEMQQSGLEGIAAAESSVSHSVQMQNATQPQMSVSYPKVKRDDHHAAWSGIKPKSTVYNYVSPNNPVYVYRKL